MLFFNYNIFFNIYINSIVMEEEIVFEFFKNNSNINSNNKADNINRTVQQIINIWPNNDNIKMLVECFYYGLNNKKSLSLPISFPKELKPVLLENVKNRSITSNLADTISNTDSIYISNFKQLLLILSHFDSNLVYKNDNKYAQFIDLNKKLSQEIKKYYDNINNNKEGGQSNLLLNNGKHQKYIIDQGNKYQILNQVDGGFLVSDKDNNVKIINI